MESYESALPVIPQPRGLRFLFGTWSGRILLINAIVFVLMSRASDSLLLPSPEVLLSFGAKDPVLLAQGQYWRFLTPVFVHIGLIHFAFNSMGIYYVGYQLERLLGAPWFLTLYVASGTFGNIASGLFSPAISAGASGSLFGLLGCGFVVERIVGQRLTQLTGRRPRRRVYASMVGTNLVLGILIPGIDNAAHIGGMLAGMTMTAGMLYVKPNRLWKQNPVRGVSILLVLTMVSAAGAAVATNPRFVKSRLAHSISSARNDYERYHLLSRALNLTPDDVTLRAQRAKVLISNDETDAALADLQELSGSDAGQQELTRLADTLRTGGRTESAALVSRYVQTPARALPDAPASPGGDGRVPPAP